MHSFVTHVGRQEFHTYRKEHTTCITGVNMSDQSKSKIETEFIKKEKTTETYMYKLLR